MAEEAENEAAEAGNEGANAATLALTGASQAKADAFLEDQRRMLHLQMEEMAAEEPFKLSHLRLRRFSGWAKAVFEFSIGLLALAAVGGLGIMVWYAAHSEGLIVESFSVPPDLAQRGLTGQVVATQILDRLTVMQHETTSSRPARSYANNWGDDLKVEIPETGVSLGEFWHVLRDRLGRETRVSGEVIRTATGIAVTARSGGAAGATFTGPEADLDRLVQQAAENVYGATQPYRYAVFLNTHGRVEEARAIDRRLAARGPAQERAWAYNGLSSSSADVLTLPQRIAVLEKAVALWPDHFVALSNLANVQFTAGRAEAGLANERKEVALLGRLRPEDTANDLSIMRLAEQDRLARFLGAYQEAAKGVRTVIESEFAASFTGSRAQLASDLIDAHDLTGASVAARDLDEPGRSPSRAQSVAHGSALRLAEARADWHTVVREAALIWAASSELPGLAWVYAASYAPKLALAQAQLGDFAAAEATIRATPGDCNPCLIARGRIAALGGQPARADYWFAKAVQDAPSIPFAYEAWGRALLARGKPDAAIAQFMAANRKGPHFADPLEGWGEALMAQNRSHLALAKFAAAEKFAPNWGRLQLKWGEALAYFGRPAEAAKHLARAASLDLTSSENAELRGFSGGQH